MARARHIDRKASSIARMRMAEQQLSARQVAAIIGRDYTYVRNVLCGWDNAAETRRLIEGVLGPIWSQNECAGANRQPKGNHTE